MPTYKGRRPGTYRVVLWAQGRSNEWVVEGRKKDAEAFEARKRVELDAGAKLSTRTSPSLIEFCKDVYQPHAEKHLKASTWEKVRVYQIATLCEGLGHLRLSELSTEAVEKFKRARTVKPSSVNNELRVLRTVLNWAKELGYPVAPLNIKKLPVRGQGRVHVWTAEQIGRLYAATKAKAPELLPLLVFLANTGCRKGEGIACEWSWIDMAGGMVRIPSNDVWRPKNGMPREVPISNSLRVLFEQPKRHPQWVFPNRHGNKYAEFPKDLFAEVRAMASLSGGPHTLRHSFASLFLGRCPDMFLLAQVLGHSHQRITELYSHLLPEHLMRARNAVDLSPFGQTQNHGGDHGDTTKKLTISTTRH